MHFIVCNLKKLPLENKGGVDQKGRRKSVKAGFWRVGAMQWIFIVSSMERWGGVIH